MVKYGERKDSFAVNSDPNSYSKYNANANTNSNPYTLVKSHI